MFSSSKFTYKRSIFGEEVNIVYRYGRWHHDVDMRPFRNNKFILKDDIVIPKEPNEYGMVLVEDFGTPNQHIVDKPKPRK